MPLSRPLATLALGALVLLAAACGGGDDDEGRITFVAGFRPQANLPFVAVYVAADRGYFADEGLEVAIEHSPSGGHLQLLLEREIEFTTATGGRVIQRRAEGLPVRAIALFGQRGDQGYVVRADSGIEAPLDFRGRSVGFKSGIVPPELKAMLGSVGLDEDDVELRGVPFDIRPFLEGQVEVYPVFLNNEPYQIRQQGVAIRIIDPHDYGVPTLGLTFSYTSIPSTTIPSWWSASCAPRCAGCSTPPDTSTRPCRSRSSTRRARTRSSSASCSRPT